MSNYNISHLNVGSPMLHRKTETEKGHASKFNANHANNSINKNQSAHVNFQGGFSLSEKIAKSKFILGIGQMANDKAGFFESIFAVALTCVLRPLTIVVTPDGSDKRDKQYAAAQSISSGVVGVVSAKLLLDPIANAGENLGHKINVNRINQLNSDKNSSVFKTLCKTLNLEDKKFSEAIIDLNKHIENSTKDETADIQRLKEYKLKLIDSKAVKSKDVTKEQTITATKFMKELGINPKETTKNEKLSEKSIKELVKLEIKPMTKKQKSDAIKAIEDKIKATEKTMKKNVNNLLGITEHVVNKNETQKLTTDLADMDIPGAIKSLAVELEKKKPSKFIREVKDAKFNTVLKETKINDNIKNLMNTKRYAPFKLLGWSYGTKFLITPILAILTIGAISPLMKKLFHKDSKSNPQKTVNNINTKQTPPKSTTKTPLQLKPNTVSISTSKYQKLLEKKAVN